MNIQKAKIVNKKVTIVVILSILFFFFCSFLESVRLKQHHAIADATSRYSYGISAAVSTLVYGKKLILRVTWMSSTYLEKRCLMGIWTLSERKEWKIRLSLMLSSMRLLKSHQSIKTHLRWLREKTKVKFIFSFQLLKFLDLKFRASFTFTTWYFLFHLCFISMSLRMTHPY